MCGEICCVNTKDYSHIIMGLLRKHYQRDDLIIVVDLGAGYETPFKVNGTSVA